MNEIIKCIFQDQTWLKIETDDEHIHDELSDYFKFKIPNWDVIRRVNKRLFYADGFIRLYKKRKHLLPYGLIRKLKAFCDGNDYKLEIDEQIRTNINDHITEECISEFLSKENLLFEIRDYQLTAITKAIRNKRLTLLSPTSSGKSFIIYGIVQWIKQNDLKENEKILVVVPNKGLLVQLKDNFYEYGYKGTLHCIQAGVDKDSSTDQIYFSTYQSIYKLDQEYFKKFKCLILDECQSIKAQNGQQCVTTITENAIQSCYKIAMSGTFHDESIHKMAIEGLYGPLYETVSTNTLIERGQVSKFKVNAIKIHYPDEITEELKRLDYQTGKEFTEANDNPRQQLIVKLAESLEENTLVLFNIIEHGKYLYSQLANNNKRKNVYFIDGSISGEERMQIISQMENESGSILVASFGTFAAGCNLRNLHNIIFGTEYKSKVRILQSVGRVLRLHDSKDTAVLYDLVDMINFAEDHYDIRKSYYKREKFPFSEIDLHIETWIKNGLKLDFLN